MVNAARQVIDFDTVHEFLTDLFGEDVHARRVYSPANATPGVMASASSAVHTIGQALAQARGLMPKHAVKQIDRLLSNGGVQVWALLAHWVPYGVDARSDMVMALDWTDFAGDDQATIALHLVTGHGRATPLVWKTVRQRDLKGRRNLYEDEVLARLAETLPAGVRVTVLTDRGFFDHRWLEALRADWGFEYVIRMRRNIQVTAASGETRPVAQWVGQDGRARTLREAAVTGEHYPVATVVCVQAKGMKESWCLVASDPKDLRFGMGMSSTHTKSPARRDRLWLLCAFTLALLTLLGAARESLGYDRLLKANTVKRHTHPLFRQGCTLYDLIPTISEHRLRPLMQRFAELLLQQPSFNKVFGFETASKSVF